MRDKKEASRLERQIGFYKDVGDSQTDTNFVNDRLGGDESAKGKLYAGIESYQKIHAEKAAQYLEKYPPMGAEITPTNPNFFREQFVRYLSEINLPESQDSAELKSTNPEKAAIGTKDFIGAKGAELYRLALEEERYSKEYINAVFNASTTRYEGEEWAKRPVVFVGGPSSSGKSFAATYAIQKASEFLPKVDGSQTGNYVVASDGGVAREVSQVRKLLLQVANQQGFTGVADLHKQSGALKNVKDAVLKAAMESKTLGIVIPETFSGYISPLDKSGKLLKDAMALENTKVVFTRVDGTNPSLFQKVVAFLGSRRAFKTSGFDNNEPLDLNKTKLVESKIYDSSGFHFGQIGSKLAEFFFRSKSKDNLVINLSNDLILKREDPQGTHNWIDANQGEKGVISVSERTFKGWQEEHKKDTTLTLEAYGQKNPLPPIITTSAGVELAVARELIRKRIVYFEEKLGKFEPGSEKYARLNSKLEHFRGVYTATDPQYMKKEKASVDELQTSLKKLAVNLKNEGRFGLVFSKSEKALNAIVKSLGTYSQELKDTVKITKELVTAPVSDNTNRFKDFKQRAKDVSHPPQEVQKVVEEPENENRYQP